MAEVSVKEVAELKVSASESVGEVLAQSTGLAPTKLDQHPVETHKDSPRIRHLVLCIVWLEGLFILLGL